MHLEVLVEEPSAEAALDDLLRRIAPECSVKIHAHAGKHDLLGQLPAKIRAYSHILKVQPDWRVILLVDEDRQDCRKLKKRVTDLGRSVGMRQNLLTRIAVEELEAWFLGDVGALIAAFPGVPPSLAERRGFRDPDGVAGGTWEALERVLQQAGYFHGGLRKIEAARAIAKRMNVEENQSRSFRVFRDGIRRLCAS
jgi:hypothetical protein